MTPSQSMFDQLKWLSFPKRIQYHASIMMYKSLNNLAPDFMIDLFSKVSESHSRNLRSVENDLLMIPFSKTRYYDRSFAICTGCQTMEFTPDQYKKRTVAE